MNQKLLFHFAQYQLAQGLSRNTVRNRTAILRQLSKFIKKPFLEATTCDLRSYLARGGIMPGSLRIERAAMNAFFNWAVEDSLIQVSPAAKLAPIRVPRSYPRPLTRYQIQRMLYSGAYKRTRVMILLGYFQGFRVSQISRVRGEDIDIRGSTIRTVAKGNKERYLPLHPMIADTSFEMPRAGWWFPGTNGHVKPESVTDAISNAIRRAGITDPALTPHSLRHSFGSDLVDAGVDIRVVQELMLHEDLSTTQIYTRVSDARKREGMATLEGLTLPIESIRAA